MALGTPYDGSLTYRGSVSVYSNSPDYVTMELTIGDNATRAYESQVDAAVQAFVDALHSAGIGVTLTKVDAQQADFSPTP